ncbi:MAG TPA: hypothetical protein VGH36_09350 [Acetobacteraceae bacterium]|jgi:hypothetical protein
MARLQDLNETEPATQFTLDLGSRTISAAGHVYSIALAEGRRLQFLEGSWDATAILLGAGPAIEQVLGRLPYPQHGLQT